MEFGLAPVALSLFGAVVVTGPMVPVEKPGSATVLKVEMTAPQAGAAARTKAKRRAAMFKKLPPGCSESGIVGRLTDERLNAR